MDEKFISESKERRKKNVEELTLKVLAKMLNDNLRYLDAHYIQDRTLEILEKTLNKLKFESENIRKARRAFLDVLLDGAKKQMFGFEDDYQLAKKDIKAKGDRKHKAIEVLKKIDRLRNGVPQGLTELRDMECEDVCQFIASELLSKELLLKDEEFVDGCIKLDNEMLLSTLYKTLFNELFDQLITSLDKSYIEANIVNWGVSRDKIRLSQINNRLINKKQ